MELWLQLWEWLGVITALIYVYLASRELRSCFLFGLISSVVFTQICFSSRLYFDTAINAYYVIMSFVGWFGWKSGKEALKVAKLKSNYIWILMGIILLLSAIFGFLAQQFTDASFPYLDAFTTVSAVVATILLVRKVIENWLIWIVANGLSIGLYVAKDHLPMALLFLIYTIISVYGYRNWNISLTTA